MENESADEKEEAITGYRVSYSVKQEIFGITITKLSQSFIYQVQGGSVVATKSCTASSANFNIVVALSEEYQPLDAGLSWSLRDDVAL